MMAPSFVVEDTEDTKEEEGEKEGVDRFSSLSSRLEPHLAEAFGERLDDLHLDLWDILAETTSKYPHREAIVSLWQPQSPTRASSPTASADDAAPTTTTTTTTATAAVAVAVASGDLGHIDLSLIEPSGSSSNDCLRWTYSTLMDRAERLAESLESLGCKPGMRLAAVLWNSAEWGLLFWAVAKVGMVFVPVDPTVPHDARALVTSVQPHVIVVQDSDDATAWDLFLSGVHEEGRKPPSSSVTSSSSSLPSHLAEPRIRIYCSGQELAGWMRLGQVSPSFEPWNLINVEDTIEQEPQHQQPLNTNIVKNENRDKGKGSRIALIIFTSGTTGTPRGCLHTERNLIAQTCEFDPEPGPGYVFRWLVHTPVSHIFAVNNMFRAWRGGDAVIFPSKSFEVTATIKALTQEQCSIMSATPTLVKALLAHPAFPNREDLNIRLVTIGGTSIGPGDIRLCREGLGAEHAIKAYGMSEGAPVISWARTDSALVDGFHSGAGRLLPGAAARICRAGSREILGWSEVGELHIGGPMIIQEYLGGAKDDDAIYHDEKGNWLATGDQAKMDKDGIVYILGRYKDLIIRGGENINPIKIESRLAEIPGVQVQVVGVPDDVAGQVPVAVAKISGSTTNVQLLEVARSLSPKYVLDAAYALEDLGLETFPVTSLGKVNKEKLKQAVTRHRKMNQQASYNSETSTTNIWEPTKSRPKPLVDRLVDLWEQLSGTRPAKDESVVYLADSITLLRFCDGVLRSCGKRIYLQDFMEHDTVEKQAQLLIARDRIQANFESVQETAFLNDLKNEASLRRVAKRPASTYLEKNANSTRIIKSPNINHGRVTLGDSQVLTSAKRFVASLGLADTMIEDTLRVRESFSRMLRGSRPQSYHNRIVFKISGADTKQIRRGLEKALASHPLLRAIAHDAADGCLYHVILSASPALLESLIKEIDLNTDAEAVQLYSNTPEGTQLRFMFQAGIFNLQEGGIRYLSLTYNHSVVDAISLMHFHGDLNLLIQNQDAEIATMTHYRLFVDIFNQYQESAPAQESISFHVRKLRGISRFKRALWPPQRAPGWIIADDKNSPDFAQRMAVRDTVWNGKWESCKETFQFPRCSRVVCLPQLVSLKEAYGLEPSLFMKSALAIYNVIQTGASQALFNTWESGRSWPFLPSWMERLLPPAMSIDGPTVQWLLNMIEVDKDETAADFFKRIISEQEKLLQNQHAPWDQIVKELRDEGTVAVDASYRQAFVWDVSIGLSFSGGRQKDSIMQPVARYDWPDCGIFWNAFMLDRANLYFIASWDTAQMNDVEAESHCDGLAAVMRKLTDERTWNMTMGEVFAL